MAVEKQPLMDLWTTLQQVALQADLAGAPPWRALISALMRAEVGSQNLTREEQELRRHMFEWTQSRGGVLDTPEEFEQRKKNWGELMTSEWWKET